MKRVLINIALLLTTVFLSGCIYQYSRKPTADLTYETWQRQVDATSHGWAAGASTWFTRGDTERVDEMNASAPAVAAMSTIAVNVPAEMTNIRVAGRFQVQIFGSKGGNSLYIYGPNVAARSVNVRVSGQTLYIDEAKDAPRNMGVVIVRIGVRDLRRLVQAGPGSIEGRMIQSSGLNLLSAGKGHIYLGGSFNVSCITSTSCGNISLFGAVTPRLNIVTTGSGTVNVSGNVGVSSITHHGYGNINVVGANSDSLVIRADGKGKIGINGRMAVCEIDARDKTCVYLYYANGSKLNVYVTDYARVGIAGCVGTLNVDAGKASRFEGHYLYATDAYVRAHDGAHINVSGTNKVFAAATESGSVYLFTSPGVLTQFYRDHGVVLPILTGNCKVPCGYCPYFQAHGPVYKD